MDRAKWAVTGNDALAVAMLPAPVAPGTALGVNLQLSDYSGLTPDEVKWLREPILHFAEDRRVSLLVIPISRLPQEADDEIVKHLLKGSSYLEGGTCQTYRSTASAALPAYRIWRR